jgi:membrane protease YdiL (CAAX protease family)
MKIRITVLLVAICIAMSIFELLEISYLIKTIIKIFLFLCVPILFSLITKKVDIFSFLKTKDSKSILKSIILGVVIYIAMILGYIVIKDFIPPEQITNSLNKINITFDNFLYVSLYISFVNSFIEEFLFRGFACIGVSKKSNGIFFIIMSSLIFSLYHIGIMVNWFSIPVFILLIIGLFACGLFFCYLNRKNSNIYNSWMIHMFANFAINSIGFYMLANAM